MQLNQATHGKDRKTIVIFASARRNGNTGKITDWIANALAIEVIDLSAKNITAYDYDHKNLHDDFLPTMDYILQYDNIIFASPVYWYAMSAQMKVFIDRTTDLLDVETLKNQGRALRGKTAYIISTSISAQAGNSFIDSFTNTFNYLGMKFGGNIHVNFRNGYQAENYKDDMLNFIQKFK